MYFVDVLCFVQNDCGIAFVSEQLVLREVSDATYERIRNVEPKNSIDSVRTRKTIILTPTVEASEIVIKTVCELTISCLIDGFLQFV